MNTGEYPTSTELANFIVQNGFLSAAPAFETDYVADAVEWFEDATGWHPFLAAEDPQARYFNPPEASNRGQVLNLRGGVYDPSTLSVTVEYDRPTNTGKLLTIDKDFALYPQEAPGRKWPFYEIFFIRYVSGQVNSIKVVNDWGFTGAISARVYDAILRKATQLALTDTEGKTGQLTRVRQGPVQYEYAEDLSTIERLGAQAEAVAFALQRN